MLPTIREDGLLEEREVTLCDEEEKQTTSLGSFTIIMPSTDELPLHRQDDDDPSMTDPGQQQQQHHQTSSSSSPFTLEETANRFWYGLLLMALLAMSCVSTISLQQPQEENTTTSTSSSSSSSWIKKEMSLLKDLEDNLDSLVVRREDLQQQQQQRRLDGDNKPSVKVAAYYYPWHGPDFHYGGGYMRKALGQLPQLGEYDDSKPATVQQHLKWSKDANIDVWISSWWGPDSREDVTARTVILPQLLLEEDHHEICLLYETSNRLKGHDGDRSTHRIIDDMKFMAKHYWDHPNYLRINGRPVVFLYISRVLTVENYLDEAMLLMRTAAAKLGHNIYIVGDQAFGTPPSGEYGPFDFFDAVTTYDVYGMLGRGYAYKEGVESYYHKQDLWRKQAQKQECAFMPAVSPGFNDRGVRIEVDHLPLSRRLSPRSPFGSLFQASLKEAMKQLDPAADNILCINSFNEWHEDSQVEPVKGTPINTNPFDLTKGLEYQAYGTLYLDILGRVTRGEPDLVAEVPDRPELPEDAFLYEPPPPPPVEEAGQEPDQVFQEEEEEEEPQGVEQSEPGEEQDGEEEQPPEGPSQTLPEEEEEQEQQPPELPGQASQPQEEQPEGPVQVLPEEEEEEQEQEQQPPELPGQASQPQEEQPEGPVQVLPEEEEEEEEEGPVQASRPGENNGGEESSGGSDGTPGRPWSALVADPDPDWSPNRYRHKRQDPDEALAWWNARSSKSNEPNNNNNPVLEIEEEEEEKGYDGEDDGEDGQDEQN